MSLAIDVAVKLPRFTLNVSWSATRPFLGIFGPSGSGKTTLLETLAGLRAGASGKIEFRGRAWLDSKAGVSLPPERRGVGYVPQDLLLFPHRSVRDNVMAGRRRAERSGAGAPDARRVIEVLELSGLVDRPVTALSGGEKQRVALGRALCSGPELLLLDEPVTGLDRPLKRKVLEHLLRVREEFSIPTVYVSHEAADVRMLADEVAVLARGSLLCAGPPADVFIDTAVMPGAGAEGWENVLSGRVVEVAGDTAVVEASPTLSLRVPAEGLSPGARAWIGVSPEDLILALTPPEGISARNILPARVREVRDDGPGPVSVLLDAGASDPLVSIITDDARAGLSLTPGARVYLLAKVRSFRVIARLPAAGAE